MAEAKSKRLMFKNVRINFPKIFKAEDFMGTMQYSVQMLFPQGTDFARLFELAALSCAEAQFPGKGDQMLKRFKGSRQSWPLREDNDGGYFLTAKRKEEKGAPLVLDQRKEVIPADAGVPYAGCWCNVSVDVFCYQKNGGGITVYLNGVQLVRRGDPLSGSATAASCKNDFDVIETPGDDGLDDDGSDLM